MSTIYDFDENNAFESIETHYFNDGYDVESLMEDGNVSIICADGEFSDDFINNVEDVFVGLKSNRTFIVVKVEDFDANEVQLLVFEMTTEEFKANWSESIWKKFREDRYVVCPLCGERKAEFCSGATYMERLEQYYCNNCHEAYVTNGYGKFMRKGTLSEPIDWRDYW